MGCLALFQKHIEICHSSIWIIEGSLCLWFFTQLMIPYMFFLVPRGSWVVTKLKAKNLILFGLKYTVTECITFKKHNRRLWLAQRSFLTFVLWVSLLLLDAKMNSFIQFVLDFKYIKNISFLKRSGYLLPPSSSP